MHCLVITTRQAYRVARYAAGFDGAPMNGAVHDRLTDRSSYHALGHPVDFGLFYTPGPVIYL